jgi:protoporphyrinogen oxidase
VIHMGHTLSSLSFDKAAKIWTATVTTEAGETKTYTAKHVISSAPIRELMLAMDQPPKSLPAAQSLRYRDFLTVALMVNEPDLFPDNWIYIHEPSVKVGRIQNFRSWSPELIPDANSTCLGLEYFCFEGDGLWASSDAELIDLAKRELAQIDLAQPDDIFDGCVVRQKKAYPVYDDSYKFHVDTIREDIEANYPNLHLVGRNGMHKYNNQDHAMMTSMLTVKNIIAGEQLYDIWNVNEDAEYHEAGASGEDEALKSVRMVPKRIAGAG